MWTRRGVAFSLFLISDGSGVTIRVASLDVLSTQIRISGSSTCANPPCDERNLASPGETSQAISRSSPSCRSRASTNANQNDVAAASSPMTRIVPHIETDNIHRSDRCTPPLAPFIPLPLICPRAACQWKLSGPLADTNCRVKAHLDLNTLRILELGGDRKPGRHRSAPRGKAIRGPTSRCWRRCQPAPPAQTSERA